MEVGWNPGGATRLMGDLETRAVENIAFLDLRTPDDGVLDDGGRNGVDAATRSAIVIDNDLPATGLGAMWVFR